MRSDFSRVLTERPRAGGKGMKYRHVRRSHKLGGREYVFHAGDDDPPMKRAEGMRYPYGYDAKSFTDLIGPLYKFMQSRVGKPWRKVHSEICQGLKGRSTQQQHLLDHVRRMVVTDLYHEDGKLYQSNGQEFYVFGHYRDFYVDPRDGILKAVADKQRKKWRDAKSVIKEMESELKTKEGQLFRRVEGIWYEITRETWMEQRGLGVAVEQEDGTLEQSVGPVWVQMNREHKRQLSTEELRQRGLENLPVE